MIKRQTTTVQVVVVVVTVILVALSLEVSRVDAKSETKKGSISKFFYVGVRERFTWPLSSMTRFHAQFQANKFLTYKLRVGDSVIKSGEISEPDTSIVLDYASKKHKYIYSDFINDPGYEKRMSLDMACESSICQGNITVNYEYEEDTMNWFALYGAIIGGVVILALIILVLLVLLIIRCVRNRKTGYDSLVNHREPQQQQQQYMRNDLYSTQQYQSQQY